MSWMLPASLCILVAMLTLATVFGYLYWTYRERYLKYWMASCFASSLRYLALIGQVTLGKSTALLIAYDIATVIAALLIVAGAQVFARGRFSNLLLLPFALGGAWGIYAPLAGFSAPATSIPIMFLLGTAYIHVGTLFLKYSPRPRPASVVVTSALFILWGIHQYDYPVLRFVQWFAPIGYMIGGTFALGTSIGMVLTYFEKTRAELLERERNFSALFQKAADSILLLELTPDGPPVIRDVNDSTLDLYGYRRDELIGQSITLLDRDEVASRKSKERESAIAANETATFTVNHYCKDGSLRIMDCAASYVRIGGKNLVLSAERDVTALRMAEEERDRLNSQLAQAQKMESVGRLAGGVAHDFNNMLSVIIGHADLALRSIPPTDSAREDLVEIEAAARRSADLTRQLLAFARKQAVSPKVLDLNATIGNSLKMLRRLIGEDIKLEWLPGVDVWPVLIDPAQVDQLLANLCVNARDAISGTGTITIETKRERFDAGRCAEHTECLPGEYTTIRVADDGCGMDGATLEKLFEPFFTTKEPGRGTGMGLATVHGIVRQNNGFITVDSAPGRGSVFAVHLPRYQGAVVAAAQKPRTDSVTGGSETILLVEDEPTLMKLTGKLLKGLGYNVLAAGSPAEAMFLAETYRRSIRLLITDVIMPEMNGRDLSDSLLAANPALKCLFMSGYTENIIGRDGVLKEGVDFIQKPFSQAELAAKVRETLDRP